ncbi:hypothetical protein EWM64_g4436 [Hericium alpestre]|uniref:Zn(2)-C6 fungal-type domain-containing protein n=1 Tax=Hericium alpestre TaxID=135208 RepID=A0A4Y9ZXI2_9AGAM|nr:hypothetical protein EWM64_g4436 [Hericium alpestre]
MDSSPSISSGSSNALQRGKACTHCRRRKMRCDGVRPVCNQCANANKHDECAYTDVSTRSRTQILEENIALLQARIQELENPGSTSSGSPQSSLSGPERIDELPANISRQLLDAFFDHSSQLGWFLNTARFRHALSLPEGHTGRPISALANTVYLFGAANMRRITGIDAPIDTGLYLSRALSDLGHALDVLPSHRAVQVIQTRVLLALYHFIIGKFAEGRHHSDAAASLVLSSGLHKIRSTQPSQNVLSFVEIIALTLPAPLDQIEEGERINAMWTAFTICRCWGVAFGAPTLLSDSEALGTQIDTPWPLDMETYERGPIFPHFRTNSTLRNFLAGTNDNWPWENHSLLAQMAGAAALFDRATYLASRWHPDTPNIEAFYADFTSVDSRIDEFQSQLYSLQNLADVDSDIVRTMHVIHCLTSAASIQLHSALEQVNVESRNKCLMAAEAIVQANNSVRAHEFLIINPVLGVLWGAACQVFIRELVFMRANPAGDMTPRPEREAEVRAAVMQLQAVMAVFAPACAFTNVQLQRVQRELQGL